MTTNPIKLVTQTAPSEPILMKMVKSFFIATETKRKYSNMATWLQENSVGLKYGGFVGGRYFKSIPISLLAITISNGYKL